MPTYYRVAHEADAVSIGDRDGTFEEAGFFHPGGTGHLAVSIEREPSGEHGIVRRLLSSRENRGHPGPDGTDSDLEFSFAGDERGVPDLDAFDIRDCVECAGRSLKRNPEVACRGLVCAAANC